MSRAEELREEATRLEREEHEAAIEARCMSHGIEWNRRGLAHEKFCEFVPCQGAFGHPHYDTYNDEYGSGVSCAGCRGSGKNFITHKIRRPEYDAPQPPKERLSR